MKTEEQIIIESLSNQHGKDNLHKWVFGLDLFYFYKSKGGVFDDNGEHFECPVLFSSKIDLINKLSQIGVELKKIPTDSPKPVKSKKYNGIERKQFKTPINGFSEYEQPGHIQLFGQNCFIWVRDFYFMISVSGNGDEYHRKRWLVDNADFIISAILDKKLKQIGWESYINRQVENDNRYISKKNYGEIINKAHNNV